VGRLDAPHPVYRIFLNKYRGFRLRCTGREPLRKEFIFAASMPASRVARPAVPGKPAFVLRFVHPPRKPRRRGIAIAVPQRREAILKNLSFVRDV
jgi:hypothetical protein